MHSHKKRNLIWFAYCCLSTLIWGWFYCYAHNDLKSFGIYLFPALLILSVIGAFYFGYRGFLFSNDWFRAKEAQRADWWDKHPRWRTTNNVLSWVFTFAIWSYLIWRDFFKH